MAALSIRSRGMFASTRSGPARVLLVELNVGLTADCIGAFSLLSVQVDERRRTDQCYLDGVEVSSVDTFEAESHKHEGYGDSWSDDDRISLCRIEEMEPFQCQSCFLTGL